MCTWICNSINAHLLRGVMNTLSFAMCIWRRNRAHVPFHIHFYDHIENIWIHTFWARAARNHAHKHIYTRRRTTHTHAHHITREHIFGLEDIINVRACVYICVCAIALLLIIYRGAQTCQPHTPAYSTSPQPAQMEIWAGGHTYTNGWGRETQSKSLAKSI